MKNKGISFYLGLIIIILVLIGGYITGGKVLKILRLNLYLYGFLLILLLASVGFFIFSKFVKKEDGLKNQRIAVISFVFLMIFINFAMIRNLIKSVKSPVLAWGYLIALCVIIVAWFITSKSSSKFKEISGQKVAICNSLSEFLWESVDEEIKTADSPSENSEIKKDDLHEKTD
ncbi:hypothetical protein KKB18_02320 [bacterium]|nr:hypothetical protein [bacterium]